MSYCEYVPARVKLNTPFKIMIGQTISHYTITGKLGSGGMGEVYLADDTKLDRQVALKFLPAAVWNEEEAQKRLIREAQSASKLDYPNIVTIYGIDEFEGQPFIIMANVPGATTKIVKIEMIVIRYLFIIFTSKRN